MYKEQNKSSDILAVILFDQFSKNTAHRESIIYVLCFDVCVQLLLLNREGSRAFASTSRALVLV